ncbi:MAG: chorismate mutase [Methanosphaera sp. rholeuAM130]|nr:MAG: chorismate mutase [Methanosphaera sp. rholeuAM130]
MINNKQVGYLGPEGTFSNEAALKVTDSKDTLVAFDNIISIFESLADHEIDEAVVPIENSTEGSVLVTLDALMHYNLKIRGEFLLPIRHYLLVQKGVTIDDITLICSHPQAIAQCRNYIHQVNKRVHATSSTADAARYVCELATAGVIGNKMLSRKYDLEVLDGEIQDYDNNVTRFALISHEDDFQITSNDKTSIILSLHGDKPGGLYEVLSIFARESINLTKIESRPSKKGMGKYLFFIDMEGHRNEPKISHALNDVKNQTDFFKVLGSYHQITVGGN